MRRREASRVSKIESEEKWRKGRNAPLELDEVNELLGSVNAGSAVSSRGEEGGDVDLGVSLGRDSSVVELDSVGGGGSGSHFCRWRRGSGGREREKWRRKEDGEEERRERGRMAASDEGDGGEVAEGRRERASATGALGEVHRDSEGGSAPPEREGRTDLLLEKEVKRKERKGDDGGVRVEVGRGE